MIELLLIGAALLMVITCGLFVAAEFAFVTVDRSKIERLAQNNDSAAKGVLSALRTLSTQLSGAQVGITITNLAIGFLAEPAVASLLRGPLEDLGLSGTLISTVAITLALLIATVITMLFGELVPKNLAISRPIAIAKAVQAPQRAFSRLMRVPIRFMNGTANLILRRFGIEPREELASARTVEELLSVVKHSANRGTLAKDTAILIERSIGLSERHASDVMTPRVKLETVDAAGPITEVIEAVKRSGFSRFPVIEREVDNVVGMVTVRNAVGVPFKDRPETQIRDIMKPAVFVPSSMELDELIERMRDYSISSAIAIDEYGGVDGMVTLEDLIEELVGEVIDEHDESGIAIKKIKHNTWSVSGLLRGDEVGQVIGLVLPENEEFETVGGLVMDLLEDVPKVGDSVSVDALNRSGTLYKLYLTVLKMDGRRVDRIRLIATKTVKGDN